MVVLYRPRAHRDHCGHHDRVRYIPDVFPMNLVVGRMNVVELLMQFKPDVAIVHVARFTPENPYMSDGGFNAHCTIFL